MTQQDYTALAFVVDRSGSMWDIAEDMEGGISALLKSQQDVPGKLTIDYVRFDTVVEHVYEAADPANVTIKIKPRGSTALYDAIGQTIVKLGERFAALPEDERPGKVIVAIVTDGYENASREYTNSQIKEMIAHQTEKYNWDFMYLGANQDAVLVAQTFGIAAGSALTYNTRNVAAASATMDSYVTNTRTVGSYAFSAADRANNA